ncbi:28S ribosomal protein S18a, mitochondrial [Episyrphus balteatus]|uniref:28S ribosomal protein S18a, mitochondrial n=1 Tax=Episyrphus balteatus TaxID=286459 RepID=UPI00248638C6|nr:28S ribosomal protein S18a, mitochondrial [Episyrphus balteatus]
MISLFRSTREIFVNTNIIPKYVSTSSSLLLKEIQSKQENDILVLQGVDVPSPRADKMLNAACQAKFCPECTLGLDIKHTDVLILSQYVRSDGCMLPRRITGLCRRQQKKMGTLVTMAQKAGLMSNLTPAWSAKDPKRRAGWKKFNKYFFESTIKY